MAYAQWATFVIQARGALTITIRDAVLQWGKFYDCQNKDNEVMIDQINGKTASTGSEAKICTCGRESSPSGTEGSFDLFDGQVHIGHLYWDCPWGSKTNTCLFTPASEDYNTQVTGGSFDSGALGVLTIRCVKMPPV
jgi:hypothetical protein